MAGNIKSVVVHLSISLVILWAGSVASANDARGQTSDPGHNGEDVYISRGYHDGRLSGDDEDGVGDAGSGEFAVVTKPRTISTGTGMARGGNGILARSDANMKNRSIGTPKLNQVPVAYYDRAELNDRGMRSQSNSIRQATQTQFMNAVRIVPRNDAPDGVYNQLAFGITAAAANSANPSENSLHANLPNLTYADAYNSQFAIGFKSPKGYDSRFDGQGVFENGYTPYLYDSSLYDRHRAISDNRNSGYADDASGAIDYGSMSAIVAQPAVYVYSKSAPGPAAPPTPPVANREGTGFAAAQDGFKDADHPKSQRVHRPSDR
jgi:hypothetical protein